MPDNNIRNTYALSKKEKSLIQHKNKLYQQYPFYINNYFKAYKFHMMDEYIKLKTAFPEIDFDVEIRVKSENSYKNKVDKKISEGYTGRVYDIFASKIIINSFNGKTDEDSLINACYCIKEFLDNNIKDSITIPNKSTDYIATPKTNGYKSIHLKRMIQILGNPNSNYLCETQIKTFRMKEYEEFGEASHSKCYKSRTPLLSFIHTKEQAEYYIPHYLKLIHDSKHNYYTITELSLEERFAKFFEKSIDILMETNTERMAK